MRTVDVEVGGIVHRLHVANSGVKIRVEPVCDHGNADRVLAALSGMELHGEWRGKVLQYQLRRGDPFNDVHAWARLPVSVGPYEPTYIRLWSLPDERAWTLPDLERWRQEGLTVDQAVREAVRLRASCAERSHAPKGRS